MTWTSRELQKLNPELLQMNENEFINHIESSLEHLPRAQRRAKQRELKEKVETIKTFTPKQTRMMVECVNVACEQAVAEELDKYTKIMDSAISTYLFIKNPDMTIDEARAEQEIITEIATEDLIKRRERIEKERGDENMANKKVNKLEPEVRAYSNHLIEKGYSQNDAIKELLIKFPTLSKSMLTNAFKRVKEEKRLELEAKALEVEKEVVEATEYIFSAEEKEKEKDIEEIENIEEAEEIKEEDTLSESENPIEIKNSNGLKITYRQISLEGKYNKYVIYKDYIKAGGETFKNAEEVQKYYDEKIKLFNSEIEELKEVVRML